MPSAPDSKPKHVWRRRLIRLFIAGVAAMLLFLGWLFLPVSPPVHSLLSRMPPNISFGLEARGSTNAWRMLEKARMPECIAGLPFVREVGRTRGYAWAALQQKAGELSSRINSALAQPFGTNMVSRCLSGAIAFACMDADGKELVFLATPDNMAWSILKLGLLFAGKKSRSGLTYLEPDKQATDSMGQKEKPFFIAISHGLVVGATNLHMLEAACAALVSRSDVTGLVAPLSPSLTLLFMPSTEVRQQLRKRLGTGCNIIERCSIVIVPQKNGFSATVRGQLNTAIMCNILAEAAAVRSQRNLSVPHFTREQISASGSDAPAGVEGFLQPELAWRALGHKLWNTPARPLRGSSQPMTVLFWEWLDLGVIAHADGRFRLSVRPASIPAENRKGVPPAPVISTAWGINEHAAALAAFNQGLKRIVDYYRAPGGSRLYQKVREDTRMELAGQTGQIFLQPLFFNHMSPAWRFNSSIAEFTTLRSTRTGGSAGTTGRPLSHTLRPPGAFSGAGTVAASGQRLAEIHYWWRLDELLCNQVRGLIRDKVVDHGFAEQEQQGQVMKKLDLLLAFARSITEVAGSGLVIRTVEKSPQFPFYLRARVYLPPYTPTPKQERAR